MFSFIFVLVRSMVNGQGDDHKTHVCVFIVEKKRTWLMVQVIWIELYHHCQIGQCSEEEEEEEKNCWKTVKWWRCVSPQPNKNDTIRFNLLNILKCIYTSFSTVPLHQNQVKVCIIASIKKRKEKKRLEFQSNRINIKIEKKQEGALLYTPS